MTGDATLWRSDQSHRRVLLVAVAGLIILGTSPVFGHHLATRADALLSGYDHLGRVCLIALHILLAPVHATFHLLLLAGLAYATWDRVRAWRGVRATLRALEATHVARGSVLDIAATRAGLSPERVRMVEGLPNPAFTVGFWRPVVYVAAALPEALDEAQLHAVLAHEGAHIARRDPLRLSMMRFLACTLFYMPALRRLAEDLTDEAEIDADDVAATRAEPLVLASAILALAAWTMPSGTSSGMSLRLGSAVPFQPFGPLERVDVLERRIRRLAGEPVKVGTHLTRRSLGGAAATLAAVWVSGVMMAHPLPAQDVGAGSAVPHEHASSHCRHKGAFALSHLFCFGLHSHANGAPCPHTGR